MTTTAGIAGNTAAKTVDSAADKARATLSGDFETFLLLLTTQLKNQDPIEPMDTNEFTAQLVQFASVEQAIQSNTNLEKLIELQQGASINAAAQYMGRFVKAEGNSGYLTGGVAAFSYELPFKAASVEVSITDANGAVVFTGPAPLEKGLNDVLWDGTNSFTGATMPDGVYKLAVVAKDAANEKIEATTFTTGFITGVNMENEIPLLQIGKVEFTADKVLAIRDPNNFLGAESS